MVGQVLCPRLAGTGSLSSGIAGDPDWQHVEEEAGLIFGGTDQT
jgi:hypothetical protein